MNSTEHKGSRYVAEGHIVIDRQAVTARNHMHATRIAASLNGLTTCVMCGVPVKRLSTAVDEERGMYVCGSDCARSWMTFYADTFAERFAA